MTRKVINHYNIEYNRSCYHNSMKFKYFLMHREEGVEYFQLLEMGRPVPFQPDRGCE